MKTLTRLFLVPVVAACLIGFASPVFAQALTPTHKDVAYDDENEAQKLDVYLARSDTPTPAMVYIHGGGWRAGSKNRIPAWLQKGVREGEFSVVSVEYRFTDVAPHPAQVNDCLRAVQFVRASAKKWNIDPERIGVTGGSAGGHLSLYVALHDDVAKADSKDPVERESSRVACAVSFAGPTDWSLLGKIKHFHPAYRQLLGYEPGTPAERMKAEAKRDVSPITFASKDDPPVMQVQGDADIVVPPQHARNLDERLESVGVRSELVLIKGGNHGVSGAGPQVSKEAEKFVRELLGK
jgi:acetyl esterase/lipase